MNTAMAFPPLNAFDLAILPDWEQHRVLQLLVCATPQYGVVGLGVWLTWLCCRRSVLRRYAVRTRV